MVQQKKFQMIMDGGRDSVKLFDQSKIWYKGNLHAHTTASDGIYSIEECIRAYKGNGYSFLCITDHRVYFEGLELKDFIVLPGTEFHFHDMESRRAFHITGININKEICSDDSCRPQYIIDRIIEAGGMAVIAHPFWSLLTHDDIMKLNGIAAIEIFNTVSHSYSCRGFSDNYVDVLASKGCIKKIIAVDDVHFYDKDIFGGWIMVQCDRLDADSIMQAINEGDYYSSQGPEFKQITVENDVIIAETSPVTSISFISDTFFVRERIHQQKGLISEAEYKIDNLDRIVRIEITDTNGKKAWSNFIKVR